MDKTTRESQRLKSGRLTRYWVLDVCYLAQREPDEFTRNKGLVEATRQALLARMVP